MMRKSLKKIKSERLKKRERRKLSIRSTLAGSSEKPRICVTKSNRNIFVQVIDDSLSKTIFSVQTFGKMAAEKIVANKEGAKIIGAKVGQQLMDHKINCAVFDRSGYKYTGVIKELVEGIRSSGIKI